MIVIPRVYVAGPYSAPTRLRREMNVLSARAIAELVLQAHCHPVVPHLTGIALEHVEDDYEFWMSVTARELSTCDAAVFVPNWKLSSGSRSEREQCAAEARPVFDILDGELPPSFRTWRAEFKGAA